VNPLHSFFKSLLRPENGAADVTYPGEARTANDGQASRIGLNSQDFLALHPVTRDLERLEQVSAYFARFGEDPLENIERVLVLCGELLQADTVLYHRLSDETVRLVAGWQAPPDFPAQAPAAETLCGAMITAAQECQAETGRPPRGVFYLPDLPSDEHPGAQALAHNFRFQSGVGKPIFSSDQVLGGLCALFREPYELKPHDEYLLLFAGATIGIEERRRLAITSEQQQNRRLEAEVAGRMEELRAAQARLEREIRQHQETEAALRRVSNQQEWLIRAARRMNESLDQQEVLGHIGEAAHLILSGDSCAAYLLDEDGETLQPVLALDEPYLDQVMSTPLNIHTCLSGRAVLERQALVFNYANKEPEAAHIPGTPVEPDEHLISAPFIVGEEILGVMTHNRVGEPFSPEELALATTFADYAAAALENARLYRSAQHALENMRQSEKRYRDLFENAAGAIYIADDEGRFLDANRAACESLGYSYDELLRMNVREISDDISGSRLKSRLRQIAEKGTISFESVHITRDGRELPVEISLRRVEQDGRPLMFGIATDISERKDREREREATIQISQALRAANNREEIYPILSRQIKALGAACCVRIYLQMNNGFPHLAEVEGIEDCPWEMDRGRLENTARAAVQSRQPVEAALPPEEDGGGGNHLLGLPMIAQGQVMGAVLIGRSRPFEERDFKTLLPVVDIAASALHRSALHEDTRRQLRRLEALHTIERAIATILNLDTLLKIVLKHVVELLDVDAADILLYETPALGLTYAGGHGFKAYMPDPSGLRQVSGLAREVVREGRMVYLPDLSRHRAGSPALEEWLSDEQFVSYLGIPLQARGQVVGVLELFHRERLQPDMEWRNFLGTLANQTAVAIDKTRLLEDLQRTNLEVTLAYDKTLEGWAKALELRDKETKDHSRNVLEWTLRLARSMGVPEEQLVHVRRGTLLHDIGKMAIPDEVLKKPAPLTPEDWMLMKQHPIIAYELLSPIPYLRPALEIPYCHHERWDGSGYPRGLQGEQIPLAARIFAVVDVWDALINDRVYRERWPKTEVRAYLEENAGVLFDPRVVQQFLHLLAQEGVGD
jgi:PAS domain S-box-containing protein